jgi:nucleotide-binding universal stress UspA family protein
MPLFGGKGSENGFVRRILVATDRSETADYAVAWAADMAKRYGAELVLLQVCIGSISASIDELQQFATEVAGDLGKARIASGEEPAQVICEVGEDEDVDVIVVGNVGMSGRKEFLLGNVPNRVSHNTRRTVVIVNTSAALEQPKKRFWQ